MNNENARDGQGQKKVRTAIGDKKLIKREADKVTHKRRPRYCNTFFKMYEGLDPANGSTDLRARVAGGCSFVGNPAENRPEGIVVPVVGSHKPRAVFPQ